MAPARPQWRSHSLRASLSSEKKKKLHSPPKEAQEEVVAHRALTREGAGMVACYILVRPYISISCVCVRRQGARVVSQRGLALRCGSGDEERVCSLAIGEFEVDYWAAVFDGDHCAAVARVMRPLCSMIHWRDDSFASTSVGSWRARRWLIGEHAELLLESRRVSASLVSLFEASAPWKRESQPEGLEPS